MYINAYKCIKPLVALKYMMTSYAHTVDRPVQTPVQYSINY